MAEATDAKQRRGSRGGSTDQKGKPRTAAQSKQIVADAVVDKAAPEWAKPYLKKLTPLLDKAGVLLNKAAPYATKAYAQAQIYWKKAEPYHPEDVLPMLLGLVLMFFGGYFVTTIACFEAFRLGGWESVKGGVLAIYEDYKIVKEASDKDDAVDADGDGVADVHQISQQELATRKLKLFMTTCNPQKLSSALSGIYTGCIAVLATLQLQFARTITLGATIGDVLSKPALRVGVPVAKKMVPEEYHKWIDVVINYACKTVGVSIAWTLQRILSAFHSALRGAQLFTDAFAHYTRRLGYTFLADGYFDEVFAGICAILGFWLQVSSWFSLPWLLYLPLLPFVILENVLTYIVAFSS